MGSVCRNLSSALFGKTKNAVLALLYGHPGQSFYLREIVRTIGIGSGTVQRELQLLEQVGILRRIRRGHQVHYEANRECPIYTELERLITKTSGVKEVLQQALAPLAEKLSLAFIYGSFARGQQRTGSDIDIVVVGSASFGEVVTALSQAQDRLGREVNPTVYSAREFAEKAHGGQHFVSTLLRGAKVFVIGDQNELTRLVQLWVADAPRNQPARGSRSTRDS